MSNPAGRGAWQQQPKIARPPPQQPPPQGPPPQQQQQLQQQHQQQQQQQHQQRHSSGGRGGEPMGPAVHTQSGVPFGHVPAYLPGSASLVEELDQKLLIVLRDGKHIVGIMISYDQFSNLILQDAVERRTVVSNGICHYHDIPLGLYTVRGDSTVLMGQIDSMQEAHAMKEVDLAELERLREQQESVGGEHVWDFDSDLIA